MGSIASPDGSPNLTRREFLNLGSLGAAAFLGFSPQRSILQILDRINRPFTSSALALSNLADDQVLHPNQQGRVLDSSINIYDIPSFKGNLVKVYYRDMVIPITDITVGSPEDSFNLVWYKVGEEGYTHSGSVQPVMTTTNPPVTSLPEGGVLAEVTVPFTDARWDPGNDKLVAYRFYYGTTYWVMEFVQDEAGNSWYAIQDDKWDYMFYVPATHLRIIPITEIIPISPEVPFDRKRIEVHLPEQLMIAYENDQPIFMARVSTGARFSNGDYSTPSGSFMTFHKRYSRHMARGNLAANGYDLPGVPWNSYITEEGIAFHGTYWHNNFGRPRSHGCINLTTQAAKWVYLWTMPAVPPDRQSVYQHDGTHVEIFS